MIDQQIASKLIEAGFSIRRDGAKLCISPASKLTPEQRRDIRDSRLVLLADFEPPQGMQMWDAEECARLCQMALVKLDKTTIKNPVLQRAVDIIKDRIDYARLNHDLSMIRDDVAGLLVALDDILPRQIGKGTQYEPYDRDTWTGWLRMSKGKPWLAIMSAVGDREACWEAMNDYSQLYKHCETMILRTGETP